MIKGMKKSIFLIIIFISVAFFSASTIYIIENRLRLESTVNDFLSSDAIYTKVKYSEDNGIQNNVLNIDDEYLLLRDDIGMYKGFAIYFNFKMNNEPDLVRGRFFHKEDFGGSKKVAVIGKEREEEIVKKDGKEYIYIENDYYNVIGILGYEKKVSAYDDCIYINLDSLLNRDKSYLNGNYIIDGRKESDNIVKKLIDSNKSMEFIEYEDEVYSSQEIKDYITDPFKSMIVVVIALILSTSIITEFWIKKRKKEIGIKRAMGANKMTISIGIIHELILISTISYIIGYLLYLLFTYLMDGYVHFYFIAMMIVFCITLFSSLIVSIIPIIKAMKMEPKDIMR